MKSAEPLPDVVYSVKRGEDNEELRYSLRSLQNIPHGNVYIAGYMPAWVNRECVLHIPIEQDAHGSKYINSRANWYAANRREDLSDDYIHMNDDFFIMNPMDKLPQLRYEGDLGTFIAKHMSIPGSTAYVNGANNTLSLLERLGVEQKYYSYELHVPMLFNKSKMREIIDMYERLEPGNIHTRTLYGNYFKVGGTPMSDVKFHHHHPDYRDFRTMDMISTDDVSFYEQNIGRYIRSRFPDKSIYEV